METTGVSESASHTSGDVFITFLCFLPHTHTHNTQWNNSITERVKGPCVHRNAGTYRTETTFVYSRFGFAQHLICSPETSNYMQCEEFHHGSVGTLPSESTARYISEDPTQHVQSGHSVESVSVWCVKFDMLFTCNKYPKKTFHYCNGNLNYAFNITQKCDMN